MGQALGMLTEAHLLTVQALGARKAWAPIVGPVDGPGPGDAD